MKKTAVAPSNIAFIKYWGKRDAELRLPLNSSISMNLSGAHTTTTVEFSPNYREDSVSIIGGVFSDQEKQKVIQCLDRIREHAGLCDRARVVTKNSFPKGAGAASSASGFAALTVAGFAAADVRLSEKDLTIIARVGSGSACRSIPDGFVGWDEGTSSETSYAHSLYPHDYWDIRDILLIVDDSMKKISTTDGMEAVATSPYLTDRLARIPERIDRVHKALRAKNLAQLGRVIEEDCLDMHHVMQTQNPPLMYWNKMTKSIVGSVRAWRNEGIPVYFTIDAGPNVHLLCEGKDETSVLKKVKMVTGIKSLILNKVARGARLVDTHLF